MSRYVVSVGEVFERFLSKRGKEILEEITNYINREAMEEANLSKEWGRIGLDIDCGCFGGDLRSFEIKERSLIQALIKSRYYGADPPWGEVYFSSSFPTDHNFPVTFKVHLKVIPDRHYDK